MSVIQKAEGVGRCTPLSTGLALRKVGVLQGVNPASVARARLGEATVTGRVSLQARVLAQGPASFGMAKVTTHPTVPRTGLL